MKIEDENIDKLIKKDALKPIDKNILSEIETNPKLKKIVAEQSFVFNSLRNKSLQTLKKEINEVRKKFEQNELGRSQRSLNSIVDSIIAIQLNFENKIIPLSYYKFSASPELIDNGKTGYFRAFLHISTLNYENSFFFKKMIGELNKLEFDIEFLNPAKKIVKRIKVKDAYCIKYLFDYSNFEDLKKSYNVNEIITITVGKITFNEITLNLFSI